MTTDGRGPLPAVFGGHCNAALIVEPDLEYGLVAIALAADRRCRIVVAPEVGLQLAHELAATVGLLRRAPERRPLIRAIPDRPTPAIIRVGAGQQFHRGTTDPALPVQGQQFTKRRRLVVTAAHCVPGRVPRSLSFAASSERTYRNLLAGCGRRSRPNACSSIQLPTSRRSAAPTIRSFLKPRRPTTGWSIQGAPYGRARSRGRPRPGSALGRLLGGLRGQRARRRSLA